MGRFRDAAFGICLSIGVACGSNSTGPASDASGPDGTPALGDDGPTDAPLSDSSPPSEGAWPDSLSSDASLPDVNSPDATVPEAACVIHHAPFDAHVPPDATCSSPDDSDYDGVPDCIDGCPYDPNKIAPGVCGCNVADFDSDGDGVPDCLDRCPHDPNNTYDGQCGCLGMIGLQPAGVPCRETACPQTGAVCDGAGVCGDRNVCNPCPGGHYVVSRSGVRYWFCSAFAPVAGPNCATEDAGAVPAATRMAAQTACAAKGLTLARLQTSDENGFVAALVASRVWLGGNDLQTPGQWYWSSATSDSDTFFWSGGADGGRQNNLYVNWASGAPRGASCASMAPVDGHWGDTDCGQMLGYLCQ